MVVRLLSVAQPAGLAGRPALGARALRTSVPFQSAAFQQGSQYVTVRRMSMSAFSDFMTHIHPTIAAVEIDWSDPDVQIGALGAFLGIALGIGTPLFYISRDRRDEERLEELRALNRATKQETGEYLSSEEIEAIRPPRWTDRREFVDDD